MNEIIRIAIVDDHIIFRKGLHLVLDDVHNFKVTGEAATGRELIELLKKQSFDIIFQDIRLPDIDGIELTRMVKKKYPDTRVIALTMFGEIEFFNKMIAAGANAFLLKKADPTEIEQAIFSVMQNETYFSREFADKIENLTQAHAQNLRINLSARETEVLNLICSGLSTNEIAEQLFLSTHTVEGHRRNILMKTGTKNTASLVKFAVQHRLIEP